MAVEITLNGEARRLDAPTSVRGLLESLGLDPAKIAVERIWRLCPAPAMARSPSAMATGLRSCISSAAATRLWSCRERISRCDRRPQF